MEPLTLVLGAQGGRDCLLSDGRTAVVVGRLPDPEPLRESADSLWGLAQPVGIVAPGADARAALREREVAVRLLRETLRAPGMEAIWERLLRSAGAAEASGSGLTLVVDARTPYLRALPWEVLGALRGDDSPLVALDLARLVLEGTHAGVPASARSSLEVHLWAPDREDPVCTEICRQLASTVEGLDRCRLSRIDPLDPLDSLGGSPDRDGPFRVLHLVSHGIDALEQVLLQVAPDVQAAPDSAARVLARLLEGVDLVVLDVCSGAADTVRSLDAPAPRLVAAGAPACIGPRMPLASAASPQLSRALYGALADGLSLLEAVAAGRRALAGLFSPHPYWRWWNPALVVGSTEVLRAPPPLLGRSVLDGWPTGAPEADAVIAAASESGHRSGFVGVEHLLLALADAGALPTGSDTILHLIAERLPRFVPPLQRPDRPVSSPRMAHIGGRIEPGFTLAILAEEAIRAPLLDAYLGRAVALAFRADLSLPPLEGQSESTLDWGLSCAVDQQMEPDFRVLPTETPPSAMVFEVVGGPDDGRLLALTEPGAAIGRWHPSTGSASTGVLFRPPLPASKRISRRHLEWKGAGRVEALGRVRVERGAGVVADLRPQRGQRCAVEIREGDRLVLRDVVVLVVRQVPPDRPGRATGS